MSENKTLVVIPTYNEKENIVKLVEAILQIDKTIDVLVVDDNSPDGTAEELKKATAYNGKRLKTMIRTKKDGRGGAVLDGFRNGLKSNANYNLFFEMDADFSHEPQEIPVFLDQVKNSDLIIGSRYLPDSRIVGWPISRRIFSKFANIYARVILRIPISDYTNGYRLYRRKVLEAIDFNAVQQKGYIVLSEMAFQIHLAGFNIGEVPTVFINRRRGISNLSFKEIFSAFHSVIRLAKRRKELKKLLTAKKEGD